MRQFLNAVVIANLAQMLRGSVKEALWICDSDEAGRFFEVRCVHPASKVIVAPGHSAEVFEIVMRRGLKGVVATVSDSSTPSPAGTIPEPNVPNMLASTASLAAVIVEAGGINWLAASESMLGDRPEIAVDNFAARLSKICWEKSIDPEDLAARVTSHIREEGSLPGPAAIVLMCMASGATTPGTEELVYSVFSASSPPDSGHSARGAFCATLLTALLSHSKPHGISASAPVTDVSCWSLLRLAFKMEDFERTRTFWALRAWQRTNSYELLREWRVHDPFGIAWDQRYWRSDLEVIVSDSQLAQFLAVLKVDLDNFRDVNSHLGHDGGDEAIRLYLETTKLVLGKFAEVYRRGGDEVVAIAPNADFAEIESAAQRLRAKIEDVFAKWALEKGLHKGPTASIGLLLAESPSDADAVTAAFDLAQREAKEAGKNRVVVQTLLA